MTNSPATSGKLAVDDRIGMAESSLERQLAWIRTADAKVSVLVAITAGMLAILVGQVPAATPHALQTIGFVTLGGLCLVFSIVCCALALFPRLKSPNSSLLYFGTIAGQSNVEYSRRFNEQSKDSYLEDLTVQIHQNATVADIKHAMVRRSTVLLLIGIPLWLLSIYLLRHVATAPCT